ncbi:hypothetical protein M0802_006041 [Mischocyttarus mexicanus]|nr:hypothetical protein M0802_006041 [Mischocyttarus mexicanus]
MLEVIEITNNEVPSNIENLSRIDIKRVNNKLTYDEFFHNYLIKNVPCIVDSTITESWSSRQQWVSKDMPNFEFLGELFGHSTIPIYNCQVKHYNSQLRADMNMTEYLNYWIKYRKNNYTSDMPLLYLKDWHCVQEFPDLVYYEVPRYFSSDWLNEYYIAHPHFDDDYRFVYMGPKGSWTPFHKDVLLSYSWSANIVGRKRWFLIPPKEEYQFRDQRGQLAYDVLSDDLKDRCKYKNYDINNLKYIDVIQEPGEEDTISINHNWINGCNIRTVWMDLKAHLSSVMKEIEDVKDMNNWAKHCQVIMRASHGMNYGQFYSFISFIAKERLKLFTKGIKKISFDKYELGKNHCLFDLKMLKIVLEDFIIEIKEKCIYNLISYNDEPVDLLETINHILRDADE